MRRLGALVGMILAFAGAPGLAAAQTDERDGLTIDRSGEAPGNDICRDADDPVDCAVARGAVNDALDRGAEIDVTVKRKPQPAPPPP
jgi:hypothetical protein